MGQRGIWRPPLAGRRSAPPSPVADAGLRLEGTGVMAVFQTAALIAAQRRDQVDGTWKTHGGGGGGVNQPTSNFTSNLLIHDDPGTHRLCVPGPGDTGSRVSGRSRVASEGPGRRARRPRRDSLGSAETWLWETRSEKR